MKRIILVVAAVVLVGGMSVPEEAHAQFHGRPRGPRMGHKPNIGLKSKLGIRGNRLNRFGGAFASQTVGSTLFDLYRTEQIPVPPYFSLHPPVYYHGIDYQRYGGTPFAYPYTWWQQFGYGYNHGPPPGSAVPAILIENPHATPDEDSEGSETISDARVAGVLKNPFVSEHSTDVRPVMVANRHVSATRVEEGAAP